MGGLLAENLAGNAAFNFVAYDGNGNVAALVSAAAGVTANYEYGPFGELIRATGPMAKLNPFRFSTKYDDDETDLLCYPYRFYNASTGRWLSRDPIGKMVANLYEFADNAPVVYLDPFGLDGLTYTSDGEYYFNPILGWGYSSQGSESGKQDSSSAWFSQSATVNNCPGGLCNSGGTGSSSSFVTATVKNSGKCSLKVHCVCNISWSGSSTTIKYNTSGFTAKSTVLDKSSIIVLEPKARALAPHQFFLCQGQARTQTKKISL